ncbi:transposase [Streptomyces venezuelae]|uniref:RNA-guided endonuclease InsQ/TnpB family protein n=1 Tax=Streptomyces gardneri TaxID=66892 RepID=UPI0006BC98C9|nr:RNA-guided endonuclease TnpB family protein [Streptomyces gardneri]ALO07839.1 transposase [Streptomyces venezuelae]QPK45140.1 IS200/IS605 family element transposase accessory protein TnpB [Streptomyces gardneri]WRK36455.1 transposase [Streptomyces venezuelae]CUM41825.1 putative transposase, IS891/IS1136/IS1341 [Streptomyces venezuelae]
MKLVVRVKLLPTPEEAAALEATLRACNEAASCVSVRAFESGRTSRAALQALAYAELKARGLSAQPALHVLRKVADAYTALRASLKAGSLGRRVSKRYRGVAGKPVVFRPDAAQPFDDRCLSWQLDKRTVSIWTTSGRMKGLAFTGQAEQLAMLTAYRKGETDLLCQGGAWYLVATCEVPEAAPNTAPAGFVGVDLGIVNIATTSAGTRHSGRRLNRRREADRRLRAKLQKKGTKSAMRRAKRHAGKEARRARDINHKISKCIVAEAERTGRGIALEDLGGIRERVRLRKPQRVTLHSWSFRQLGTFIAYKAQRAGVPVVYIDPAYTSQECSRCHHVDRRNRPSQAVFACQACGFVEHADLNSSHNIAARGWWTWVRGAESQAPALTLTV